MLVAVFALFPSALNPVVQEGLKPKCLVGQSSQSAGILFYCFECLLQLLQHHRTKYLDDMPSTCRDSDRVEI